MRTTVLLNNAALLRQLEEAARDGAAAGDGAVWREDLEREQLSYYKRAGCFERELRRERARFYLARRYPYRIYRRREEMA